MKVLSAILLAFLLSLGAFAQEKKPIPHVAFLNMIDSIKPGITKDEVIKMVGKPYKVSFMVNKQNVLVEQMTYRVSVYIDEFSRILYSFVFHNKKLVALTERELFSGIPVMYKEDSVTELLETDPPVATSVPRSTP